MSHHDFVPGGSQYILLFDLDTGEQTGTDSIPVCEVCCRAENADVHHPTGTTLDALLAERVLADDLYLALSQLLAAPIWANQAHADVVLARYREARGR